MIKEYLMPKKILKYFENEIGNEEKETKFTKKVKSILPIEEVEFIEGRNKKFEIIYTTEEDCEISEICITDTYIKIGVLKEKIFIKFYFYYGSKESLNKNMKKYLGIRFFNYEDKGLEVLFEDIYFYLNKLSNKELSIEYLEIPNGTFKKKRRLQSKRLFKRKKYGAKKILEFTKEEINEYENIKKIIEQSDDYQPYVESESDKYLRLTKNYNFNHCRVFDNKLNEIVGSINWKNSSYNNKNYKVMKI